MKLRKILVAFVSALALFTMTYAQEVTTKETQRPGQERPREGRRHGGIGRFRGMHGLNLTEEQRNQQRAILQRHLGNMKGQREELFDLREKRIAGTFTAEDEARAQQLREEIRSSMQGIRTEMEGVLTAEQRAKLEQLKSERKVRRDEMRERRRELRERREKNPL